jgi:photosystem II stability/assembly factor-like uncharacterized protein
MKKRLLGVIILAFLLSGCSFSFPAPGVISGGSIWKSFDAGQTFVPKITIDEKSRISSADVLSMVFHPTDSRIIYIGMAEDGIFKTTDGGEHWQHLNFPPLKNYGLTIDQANGERLFASGVYNGTSKIYRSLDAGQNWKEIYTEPGQGTVVTALASHPDNSQVLYAGTSAGVVIKSINGGDEWKNISIAKGPVTQVLFESGMPELVTLLVFNQGVVVSADGGKNWDDYASQAASGADQTVPQNMVMVVADPGRSRVLYAGAQNGLFRSQNGGKTWEAINIIESSKKFPIRSLAVNPHNSQDISYAAGAAFYRSIDGGAHWMTTQLEIDRGVSLVKYDPAHPENIYFTLRKF